MAKGRLAETDRLHLIVVDQCDDFCAPYYSNYLEWSHPGLGPPVTFMVLQGFAFFALLFFFESGVPGRIWQKVCKYIS